MGIWFIGSMSYFAADKVEIIANTIGSVFVSFFVTAFIYYIVNKFILKGNNMCFSVIAGKNTTKDGNFILGVNNDWTGYPGTMKFIERKKNEEVSPHTLVSAGQIPNVKETFSYIHSATSYDTGMLKNNSWWGGVNENKVAVGIQGVYSFEDLGDNNPDSLETDDIPILILQRAKTARNAVKLIGELIKEYGFKVSSIEGGEGFVMLQ